MGTAIDMDYCMIVIEKLINPMTPEAQVMPLLRDLMDSVSHPDMKKLAERIVDPELGLGEKRKLMEDFRNFDHGGANSFADVDYTVLIDKFIDPNLPDHEYKPTMKALLDGDLDQEKKNMIIDIINTPKTEREKIANKVKRFKSFFDREREEKERAERERKEAKAKREKEKAELEANLLVFTDDGMTLVMKMIDKKMPAEKRTQLYERLMEPDPNIGADIKNLAIQLTSTKRSDYLNVVEKFKKDREEERLAEIKRKEEATRKKIEEEQALKDSKMKRKQELLANKNKSERMKKRELMLKYRAAERAQGRGGGGEGYVGPGSVQEREEWRRRERQKVAEEIRRFREKAKHDMLRQEREDRRKEGWTVTPMDMSYNVSVNVVVPDLMTILSDEQKALFEKAVEAIKAGIETKPTIKEKEKSDSKKTEPAVTREPPPPVEDEENEEFKEYFKIFSNPDLSEKDEANHIKKLVADKKSALVRKLVIKLASVEGAGKSMIFKNLAKKLAPSKPTEEKKVDAIKSDSPKPDDASCLPGDKKPAERVDSPEGAINGIVQNGKVGTADESRKRHASSESIKSNSSSKKSEHSRKRHVSNESTKSNVSTKSKERRNEDDQSQDQSRKPSTDSSMSNDSGQSKVKNGLEENKENKYETIEENKDTHHTSADKKKKKKHKHKDDDLDKEKEGGEKKHKKHKHKEKHKHKDKHNRKDKEVEKNSPDRIDKKRNSVDSTVSNSSSKSEGILEPKPQKPIDDMSLKEIKQMFNLQSIDAYVKVKNCKKLYRQIQEAMEARRNVSDKSGKRARSSSSEGPSSKKQRNGSISQPPSRPISAQTTKFSRKSRSPSRSLSRSRSRSVSRSPVRYVSRTPSRSLSRSVSRSPVRLPSPMSS